MPQPKKRDSKVGFVTDPFRMRRVWYESGLEESVAYFLLAKPETLELREQQKVQFFQNGQRRTCWIDFIQRQSGGRIAYAVKHKVDVDEDLRETLRLVCEQIGDRIAEEFRIFTEKDLTLTQIENAKDIVAYAADYDFEAQTIVAAALPKLPARISLHAIAQASGLGERGWRAAVTLIQKGLLVVPANVRLGDQAILVNHGANERRR
ncbi:MULTISPECIES: hypothetical protein [unclassified Mesorhizobium]|uniref:hypothetical protein n=1 Tax=unclassified Mesorhizobium TaxID=325217 RepID=UPI00112C7BC5|nr:MULTISPECIES: hypothetical protein [unclassified Mesorhizobium]TPK96981.1 hypothetical protein FJ567_20040 [Mesorhizobium sp. B2-4-16]TPL65000.1 hypothetical protein FJ956_21535 [Mesorhizobium sp. B2-4-3]